MRTERWRQLALFVGIVVVVVGASAAVPAVQSDGPDTPTPPNVTNEQFQPGEFPASVDDGGEIRMDSDAETKTVLVDTGHGNDVSGAKVATLTRTLVENGHEVEFLPERVREMNESLRRADALVVVNPTTRYTHAQVAGVQAFAEAGGRVVVLSDPPRTQISGGLLSVTTQQVGAKTGAVGSPLGVAFGSDYLYSVSENANNYKAVFGSTTDAGNDGIGAGVDRVVLRGATPVTTGPSGSVAIDSEATLESTRRSDTYAVAVRNGNVSAVGDSDFLSPTNAYAADNEVLVGNLADFLVTGTKSPEDAPTPPATPTGPGMGGPYPPGSGPTPPGPTTPTNSTA